MLVLQRKRAGWRAEVCGWPVGSGGHGHAALAVECSAWQLLVPAHGGVGTQDCGLG